MAEAIWGEFERADAMAAALADLRARGHTAVEAFSPFFVPETVPSLKYAEVIGPIHIRPMILPGVALIAGTLGGVLGYIWMWFTNVHAYPQNAGGRPVNAIPAFAYNTFETIVLGATCGIVLTLLVVLGLPRLFDERETIDGFRRISDDRFALLITDPPPWLVPDETERILLAHGAAAVRRVELP